jgi:hypothetical protein
MEYFRFITQSTGHSLTQKVQLNIGLWNEHVTSHEWDFNEMHRSEAKLVITTGDWTI